jgi:hypothetical protein
MINLKTAIPTPVKLLTHWMGWHGQPSRVNHVTRYRSVDPWAIDAQLDAMQAVGIDGAIATWQGPTVNPYLHQATIGLCERLGRRQMLFALLLDPWIAKGQPNPTQVATAALQHPDTVEMLASSAYLPEKYVLEFDLASAGVNVPQLVAAFPKSPIISKHSGYSWPEISSTMAILAADNANPAMKIPGVILQFFDGGQPLPAGSFTNAPLWNGNRDYNTSVWGGSPARMIEHQAGNIFLDSAALVPKSAPYAAVVTWNDYEEGTAIEPFCSMISGIRIGK